MAGSSSNMHQVFRIYLLVSVLFVGSLSAQTPTSANSNASDIIEMRANGLVNEIMDAVNARADAFNTQISQVYALMPLESIHLDSATIRKNIQSLRHFLQFLERYRAEGKVLTDRLEDSLKALRAELPKQHRARFLNTFHKVFLQDITAFDAYTVALDRLYKKVIASLEYMLSITFGVTQQNKLEFTREVDYKRYLDLMAQIEKANKEVQKASERSRKATAAANKTIEEVYGNKD